MPLSYFNYDPRDPSRTPTCSICQSTILKKDLANTAYHETGGGAPHIFHSSCISNWWATHPANCPLCHGVPANPWQGKTV